MEDLNRDDRRFFFNFKRVFKRLKYEEKIKNTRFKLFWFLIFSITSSLPYLTLIIYTHFWTETINDLEIETHIN